MSSFRRKLRQRAAAHIQAATATRRGGVAILTLAVSSEAELADVMDALRAVHARSCDECKGDQQLHGAEAQS